ncbi:MAG: phage terminase large subunit family protein, partial [Deltaproteobacteria bacterium]|nr:phage terminase large subunit family protein [Deltaproteobacteria bacterium]
AGYKCGRCGKLWSTVKKNNAVEDGQWVERKPFDGEPKSVGAHVNRLYSLLGKSGDIPKLVGDYVGSIGSSDPKDLQNFINSALAEPWIQVITRTEESTVLKAKCDLAPMTIPDEAIAITCGVDVQKYGFWFLIRAWAKDYTSWLVHYGFLSTYDDVRNLLFKTEFRKANGTVCTIWRTAMDTGGGGGVFESEASQTEQTYWFIRQHGAGRIWGTKGSSKSLAAKVKIGNIIDKTPSGKPLPGGIQLIMIDTNRMKDVVMYRLTQAVKQRQFAAYLHRDVGDEYAAHIMAEEKRVDNKGQAEWVLINKENHLLDCEVLAHACAEPEWPGGGINIVANALNPSPAVQQQQQVVGSSWLNRSGSFGGSNWVNRR